MGFCHVSDGLHETQIFFRPYEKLFLKQNLTFFNVTEVKNKTYHAVNLNKLLHAYCRIPGRWGCYLPK